jgi:hypothetical protein
MKHVPMQHPSNEDLFAYRDGELMGEKRFLIEAHVVSCATCRELVDGMSGIEADLKNRPDDVGEEYYAGMTDSVLAKIGARAGSKAPERARRPADDVPRVERRRPEAEPDAEGPRRRPRLPWFGVVGAGAAAASVLVVVIMLAQRQGEWVRAPRPASTDAPEEPLATFGDSAAEREYAGEEGNLVGEKAKTESLARSAKETASDEIASTLGKQDAAGLRDREERARGSVAPAAEKAAANEPQTVAARDLLAEDKKRQLQKDAAPSAAMNQAAPRAQAPPAGAVGDAAGGSPSDEYAAVLRAHGLPPVFDPARVDRDALLKVENDLRYLYMAGRANTDSARVRLYLAEAARAKVDTADSAAVEGVIHHYWRAIRLSREDPAVAAVARRRLAEFLREVGREP